MTGNPNDTGTLRVLDTDPRPVRARALAAVEEDTRRHNDEIERSLAELATRRRDKLLRLTNEILGVTGEATITFEDRGLSPRRVVDGMTFSLSEADTLVLIDPGCGNRIYDKVPSLVALGRSLEAHAKRCDECAQTAKGAL